MFLTLMVLLLFVCAPVLATELWLSKTRGKAPGKLRPPH